MQKSGTVGLFAEDSLESIHALVHLIVSALSSLDGERKKGKFFASYQQRATSQ
jgi:hypothetical protein